MRPEFRLQCFARADSGAVAVIWAMMLVVFFGFIAMIFDIGRVAVTQSELQSFADHVAVAAAGELNGEADSLIRAQRAVDELIADTQTFGAARAN
jgi:Flp pilus assembly protein TadG